MSIKIIDYKRDKVVAVRSSKQFSFGLPDKDDFLSFLTTNSTLVKSRVVHREFHSGHSHAEVSIFVNIYED